jgi:hypothetical protein
MNKNKIYCMIQYFILFVATVAFVAYYLNYNPFVRNVEEVNTNDIEISINELKNLNQYIDNGTTNHPSI